MDARRFLPVLSALAVAASVLAVPVATADHLVEVRATTPVGNACFSLEHSRVHYDEEGRYAGCPPVALQPMREGRLIVGVMIAGEPVCFGVDLTNKTVAQCDPVCGKPPGELGVVCRLVSGINIRDLNVRIAHG